jgi:hypothetical protein
VTGNSAEVNTQITKQFINGQWVFTPEISVPTTSPSGITYSMSAVSVWAVSNSALNTYVGGPVTFSSTNHASSDTTWPVLLNGNPGSGEVSSWNAAGAEQLSFAYSGIPVGFVKPTISILNSNTQFPLTVSPDTGSVTLLKEIYIINGYQVVAVKTITPTATAGQYTITIKVTNNGNIATPPDVLVYDIVPSEFISASPLSPAFGTGNQIPIGGPVNVANTGFSSGGSAYYWNVGPLAANGGTFTVTYTVTGPSSGSYPVSDLYVVGVDPAYAVNSQVSPAISNYSTMVSNNFEPIAALGALGLILVGMIGTARRRL